MSEQVVVAQRERAVELDRGVDHPLRRFGRLQLGHRRELADRLDARVVLLSRVVDEQSRRGDRGDHVRQPVPDPVHVRQRRPELAAGAGMADRGVGGGLGAAEGERADADPEQLQGMHGDVVTSTNGPENRVVADEYVVEVELADGMAHDQFDGPTVQAGGVAGTRKAVTPRRPVSLVRAKTT